MIPTPSIPGRWLDGLWREVRYAVRSLRRAPGFSLAVFATLVVCIGPNTAILSVLYGLVLKPLPFPDARELVVITNVADRKDGQVAESSFPQYLDFKDNADLFAGFAVLRHLNITLDSEETPMRVPTDHVSVDYFDLLGVKPLRGRFFDPEEGQAGRENVLVLAYDFWVSHYHADEGVIGREFRAAGTTYTIIGVAPRSLVELSQPTCFFKPYVPHQNRLNPQARYWSDCTLFGRLKPGVTPEAGFAQLTELERRFREQVAAPGLRETIETNGYRIAIQPLRPGEVRDELHSLWFLQAGALLVLLIGGVNVANLFLARMNARRAELAVRVALGAGRATLLRQVVVESTLLTGVATVAGVGVAALAIHVFNRYLPLIVRTAPTLSLDLAAVGLIAAAMLVVAFAIGLLPHLLLWRTGLRLGDARGATRSGAARVVSGVLVTTQVAVAVVLLVGAGLLIRSFARVTSIDPGFDAPNIVQGRIALPPRYSEPEDIFTVQRRIQAALREIPGVQHTAQLYGWPLLGRVSALPVVMRDEPSAPENQPQICYFAVSPDYFATMGIRVLEGRGFTDDDEWSKEPVVIVDETFARRYFPGRIVVGREIWPAEQPPPPNGKWARIIGVVNRANLAGLEEYDNVPFAFAPVTSVPNAGFNVVVRSPRPSSEILREVRGKLREIDPALPLYAEGSLQDAIDARLLPRRGIMLLIATFSGLALALAAIGLYGALAYDVSQRTREIGIRSALGASRGSIIKLVLRQSLWKTGIGLLLGLAGGFILSRSMQSLLFEVTPLDPIAYLAVCTALLLVAALASWLPARRAVSVDPVIALRSE